MVGLSDMNGVLSPKSRWNERVNRFKDRFGDFIKNRLAFLGIIIVIFMVLIAILAPLIQVYDPLDQNIGNRMQAPTSRHIFGTDHFGRDVWSRIVNGARIALLVGIVSVGIGILFGLPIGAIAGITEDGWMRRSCGRWMHCLPFPPF
jgi:peptide/nickel transport system permease protein